MSIKLYDKSGGTPQEVLLAGIPATDLILNGTSKNPIANKTVYNALATKIESTVENLVNFYNKSQVYNKQEVRDLIGAINTLTIEVVNELPTQDISATTIYFLKQSGANTYDEYIYVDNAWVKIGDTDIDLSGYLTTANFQIAIADYYTKSAIDAMIANYYTKTQVDAMVDAKQDALTFDSVPTEGSTNPVQSGGTFNAIKAVSDDVDELSSQMQVLTNKLNNEAATRSAMGAKNLIPFDLASIKAKNSSAYPSGSWNNNEWTINGVTFAIQDDNTVVATGANTSNSNAQLDYYITIKGGVPYIANGCPSGGSDTTYRIANYCSTSPAETFVDNGNGVSITRAADTAIIVHMQVRAGYTIDGQLVFKPMVRLATDSDATYQPYAKTNLELAEDINAFVNNVNVNGCKNRFVLTMEQLIKAQKSNGGTWNGNTYTFRGVTFTCNTDDSGIVESVTVNGTATGKAGFRFSHHDDADVSKEYYKLFSENSYMVTGAKTVPRIIIDVNNGGTWVRTQRITSDSEVTLDLSGGDNITVYIEVPNGETANNITIYPMLCLKSDYDIDPTYEPYSKTNRELTLDSVTWDNLSEVGAVNYCNFDIASGTKKGYTFTNDNGVIHVTGSRATGETGNVDYRKDMTLKAGTYRVSGCPSGGGTTKWRLLIAINNSTQYAFDYGDGAVFTLAADSDDVKVYCTIMADYSDSVDMYYKPMITPVSYNGPYVPYAKTNKELTDCVAKNYSFSVSFDGEKTVRDVLNELETMIENYITNNPSRLLVVLNIRSFALDMNCPVGITSNNIPGGFAFGGAMYMSNGANKIHAGSIRTSNSQLKYSIGDAVTDLTLTKPTSGNIQARCILF